MDLLNVFLLIVVTLLHVTNGKVPDTLLMVHYLFRHGDRSPVWSYKGDLNPVEQIWPKGPGQLTTIGMNQHYNLGRYFRKRYKGFINDTYFNREVHVRSTDVDRTLMSAYSHLAGLYPPHEQDVWNKDIPWQPIPVHTVPEKQDFVLSLDLCPRQVVLHREVFKMPYFMKIYEEYKEFLDWFNGKIDGHYDLQNVFKPIDPIYIEYLRELPLPSFINETVLKKLIYLDMINFKGEAYTTDLKRVTGGAGPTIKDLIERVKLKIQGKLEPDLKLYIYSAHDSTVSSLLHALKCFNDISPPYAAAVIMELHQVDQDYYLQFSYKNDSKKEPYDLVVPGCSKRCPFDKFVELTKPIISDDVEKECQLPGFVESQYGQKVQLIVFASIAGISMIIVLLQVVLIISLNRRNKNILYERVEYDM